MTMTNSSSISRNGGPTRICSRGHWRPNEDARLRELVAQKKLQIEVVQPAGSEDQQEGIHGGRRREASGYTQNVWRRRHLIDSNFLNSYPPHLFQTRLNYSLNLSLSTGGNDNNNNNNTTASWMGFCYGRRMRDAMVGVSDSSSSSGVSAIMQRESLGLNGEKDDDYGFVLNVMVV
ncbi:transcription factor MYB54-like [Senna tora]|uniref:Transcription factor MYB54-like n=1 Tax=Senna tora TaxID=362788 RepID=A0A834SIF1_9FABA|nr:transcription factor MYB54-like [Senna tora]